MTSFTSLSEFLHKSLNKLLNAKLIDGRNVYKHWEIDTIRKLLTYCQVDCVFDVGANTGQYAGMLRNSVGYQGLIISFEPDPGSADLLRKQARNSTNWLVEECAISSANGHAMFNIMSGSKFSSLSKPRHDKFSGLEGLNTTRHSVRVKTERLDTALARLQKKYSFEHPFLKMDTQGYDYLIVDSARDCMGKFVALQSELSVVPLYESCRDFRDALKLYEECGFELSALIPNNSGHFPKLLEVDCVMVRSARISPP